MKSSLLPWLLSVREPQQWLAALPSPGILPQRPPVQLDFTSGNSSKENFNNHNVMGDMSGKKKITALNPVLTCNGKQAMGLFPWEILEAVQWVEGKDGGRAHQDGIWKGRGPWPRAAPNWVLMHQVLGFLSLPAICYTWYQDDWKGNVDGGLSPKRRRSYTML